MSKSKLHKHVIDLNNLEKSLTDPALLALMTDGWTVLSSIPVDDNGAKLILILKSPDNSLVKKEDNNLRFHVISSIIIFELLINIIINFI